MTFEAAIAFLFGLLLGSFLNVCIHRWPQDLSVAWPGSRCPKCGHPLAPLDNIPVVSWVALGGRCRYCRASIAWRYPIVEFLTASLFAAGVVVWGPEWAALKFAVFAWLQIGLIFADIDTRTLPDQFTLGGLLVGVPASYLAPIESPLMAYLLQGWSRPLASVAEALVAAALASGALWLVGFLYQKVRHKEGLGFGDVKMVAMIGAFLGIMPVLATIFAACVAGTVLGVGYIRLTNKDLGTYELPFASFLGAAAIAVALFRL